MVHSTSTASRTARPKAVRSHAGNSAPAALRRSLSVLCATSTLAALMSLPAVPAHADMTSVVANGNTQAVVAHGACRRITNNNSADLMVPHGTIAEWVSGSNAFLANLPSNVQVADCVVSVTTGGRSCSRYDNWFDYTMPGCVRGTGLPGLSGYVATFDLGNRYSEVSVDHPKLAGVAKTATLCGQIYLSGASASGTTDGTRIVCTYPSLISLPAARTALCAYLQDTVAIWSGSGREGSTSHASYGMASGVEYFCEFS